MCECYEILYRWWWNRKFKRKPLKEQNGYLECHDDRQRRYEKYVYGVMESPNIGFIR